MKKTKKNAPVKDKKYQKPKVEAHGKISVLVSATFTSTQ